ncbi:hypothetical protein AMTRI_Chr12g271640 [Amborella trichopoda]
MRKKRPRIRRGKGEERERGWFERGGGRPHLSEGERGQVAETCTDGTVVGKEGEEGSCEKPGVEARGEVSSRGEGGGTGERTATGEEGGEGGRGSPGVSTLKPKAGEGVDDSANWGREGKAFDRVSSVRGNEQGWAVRIGMRIKFPETELKRPIEGHPGHRCSPTAQGGKDGHHPQLPPSRSSVKVGPEGPGGDLSGSATLLPSRQEPEGMGSRPNCGSRVLPLAFTGGTREAPRGCLVESWGHAGGLGPARPKTRVGPWSWRRWCHWWWLGF